MLTLRHLNLAATIALISAAPASGQREQAMSAGLVEQLQNVEVQEQLIALGVLDAAAGQASRSDLRKAVEWFRKAYQSARGVEPLTDEEMEKLRQAKAKFYATTGLKELTYKDPNPTTKTDIQLLVPLKFVEETPQKFDRGTSGETGRSTATTMARWPSDLSFTYCPTTHQLRCSGRASCRCP